MKLEEGTVIEVNGNIAIVRASKHSDCKNCGACSGTEATIISTLNKIGAKPGQQVAFELKGSNSLKGAFMIFVLPLISVFAGAFFGKELAELFQFNRILCELIGGAVLFIAVILLIKLFDRSVGKNENSLPVIRRIIK